MGIWCSVGWVFDFCRKNSNWVCRNKFWDRFLKIIPFQFWFQKSDLLLVPLLETGTGTGTGRSDPPPKLWWKPVGLCFNSRELSFL
jgi:hypothetical protein